jgi:hypothetical protein
MCKTVDLLVALNKICTMIKYHIMPFKLNILLYIKQADKKTSVMNLSICIKDKYEYY